MPNLEATIRKGFPDRPGSGAFSLDLSFEAGSGVTALFGPSGSGKTLTLGSIAGFSKPDGGRIVLDGRELFDSDKRIDLPARLRRCGYLFQRDALFPHMSVRENLEFAAAHSPAAEPRPIDELLDQFRITGLASRRPHEISGGERQRCAIARTLVGRPNVLLMDEPAQGLDVALRRELHEIVRTLRLNDPLPMLLVTHDLWEAFALADTMLVVSDGRIIQRGAPRAVYEQPASGEVARLLGIQNVFQGRLIDATSVQFGDLRIPLPAPSDRAPGSEMSFCIHGDALRARPRNGSTADGRCVVRLADAEEGITSVRLRFAGGLSATMPRDDFKRFGPEPAWEVEFPPGSVWVFPEA